MRKLLLCLSALACCSTNVLAKDGPQSMTTGIVIGGGNFPHFDPKTGTDNVIAFKNYRVIAKTYTMFSGSAFKPIDSTYYKYSKGRGSLISVEQPNYDESVLFDDAITYYYNHSAAVYDNKLYRKQTFNDSNNILSLTYATWKAATAAWKDSARYQYSYIAGTGKIQESMFQLWVGGTWAHDVPSVLTYSGNNVIDVQSLSYSASYVYDANNNIISVTDKVATHGSGTLAYNERKTYTYNAGNEVATYIRERWNTATGSWDKTEYFEYTYSGSNLTESILYVWNNNMWETYSKSLYTYNSNNDKTSETTQLWSAASGTFVNSIREIYAYNTAGLLESVTTQKWDVLGYWKYADGNTQIRYYYEYYFTTSVSNVADNSSISVYPVPAKDRLTISLGNTYNQQVSLSIRNMNGAVVKQWNTTDSETTTDISALPNGTYVLYCRNDRGEVKSSKLTVSR